MSKKTTKTGTTPRSCAPGECRGMHTCSQLNCQGHPANQVLPSERDPLAMRWFWITYVGGILCALVLITQADDLVAWLLG